MIDLRYLTSGVCLPVCLPVTYRSLLPLHLNSKKLVVALSIILRMITHRVESWVSTVVSLLVCYIAIWSRNSAFLSYRGLYLTHWTDTPAELRWGASCKEWRRLRVELVKWGHYYWSSAPQQWARPPFDLLWTNHHQWIINDLPLHRNYGNISHTEKTFGRSFNEWPPKFLHFHFPVD